MEDRQQNSIIKQQLQHNSQIQLGENISSMQSPLSVKTQSKQINPHRKNYKEVWQNIFHRIQQNKGLLIKQGKKLGFQVKRYFIIKGDCLIYYKTKNQQKVQGIVNLLSSKYKEVESFQKTHPYCIAVKGFVEHFTIWIFCENYEEKKFFLYYLHKASKGDLRENIMETVNSQNLKNQQQFIQFQNSVNGQKYNSNFNSIQNKQQQQNQFQVFKRDRLSSVDNSYYQQSAKSIKSKDESICDIPLESNFKKNLEQQQQMMMNSMSNIQMSQRSSRIKNSLPQSKIVNVNLGSQNSIKSPIKQQKSKLRQESILKEESDCNIDIDDQDIPKTSDIATYEFAMQNIKSLSKQQIYIEPKSSKIKHFDSNVSAMKKNRGIGYKILEHEESILQNSSMQEGPSKMYEQMKMQSIRQMKFHNNNNILKNCYNNKKSFLKNNNNSNSFIKKKLQPKRGISKTYHGGSSQNCLNLNNSYQNNKDFQNQKKKILMAEQLMQHQYGDIERPNCINEFEFDLTTDEDIIEEEFNQLHNLKIRDFKTNENGITKLRYKKKFQTNKRLITEPNLMYEDEEYDYDNQYDEHFEYECENYIIEDTPPNIQQSQLKPHFLIKKQGDLDKQSCFTDRVRNNKNFFNITDEDDTENIRNFDYDQDHDCESMENLSEDNFISQMIGNYSTINLIQKDFTNQQQQQLYNQKINNNGKENNFKKMSLQNQHIINNNLKLPQIQQTQIDLDDEDINSSYSEIEFDSFDEYNSISTEDPNITMKKKNFNSNCLQNNFNFKSTLMKGINAMWQFQMKEARKQFALYNLELSQIYEPEIIIFELLVSGEKGRFEKCENRYNDLLKSLQDPNSNLSKSLTSIEHLAIISEIYLIKAMLNCFQNQKFQAVINLKNSYSGMQKLKRLLIKIVPNQEARNRILFLEGVYNIGLELIPSIFSKLLSVIGINTDYQKGIQLLKDCIKQYSIRSYWACLILSLYYSQIQKKYDLSLNLLKQTFNTSNLQPLTDSQLQSSQINTQERQGSINSPLCLWVQSIISWKKGLTVQAILYINQAIENCRDFKEQAYFLHFEIGWYSLTQTDWKNTLKWFELVLIYSQEVNIFDVNEKSRNFQKYFEQYSSNSDVINDPYFNNFIQVNFNHIPKVTFPHKVSVLVILAISHIAENRDNTAEAFLVAAIYLDQQISNDKKSHMDTEFGKLAKIFCKRKVKKLLIFEILYFVKEFDKLPKELQQNLVDQVQVHDDLITKNNNYEKLSKDNQVLMSIEKSSCCLLQVCIYYIWEELDKVQQLFNDNQKYFKDLPENYQYLAHHTLHWTGVSYYLSEKYDLSQQIFQRQIEIKDQPFDLSKKAKLFLKEIEIINKKKNKKK